MFAAENDLLDDIVPIPQIGCFRVRSTSNRRFLRVPVRMPSVSRSWLTTQRRSNEQLKVALLAVKIQPRHLEGVDDFEV